MDLELRREHGANGLSLSRAIYKDLSPQEADENGALRVLDSDSGQGHQLMLLFQAFGRVRKEAFDRLERVFSNLEAACRKVSMALLR